MSAWQNAEIGPLTSSPAAQLASSATVIFWSASVEEMTTHVTTPAIAMMMPTTMAVIAATVRMNACSLWAGSDALSIHGRPVRTQLRHGQCGQTISGALTLASSASWSVSLS